MLPVSPRGPRPTTHAPVSSRDCLSTAVAEFMNDRNLAFSLIVHVVRSTGTSVPRLTKFENHVLNNALYAAAVHAPCFCSVSCTAECLFLLVMQYNNSLI